MVGLPPPRRCADRLLRRAAVPAAPLLAVADRAILRRWGRGAPAHPVVFLVGAPRTGSTLLFQLATDALSVAYTDNLAAAYYRNWLAAMWFSSLWWGDRPHGIFESRHGAGSGWHAPSEAGEYWYRFVPRERHALSAADVAPEARARLRAELVAATRMLDRPLVVKNLPCGQRMRLLADVLPEASFVHCRRDTVQAVLSILAARRQLGVPPDAWWSVMPPDIDALRPMGEIERVVAQVLSIEARIEEDRHLFPSTQFTAVDYRETCEAPGEVLSRLASFCGARRRPGASMPVLRPRGTGDGTDAGLRAQVARCVDEARRQRHVAID